QREVSIGCSGTTYISFSIGTMEGSRLPPVRGHTCGVPTFSADAASPGQIERQSLSVRERCPVGAPLVIWVRRHFYLTVAHLRCCLLSSQAGRRDFCLR